MTDKQIYLRQRLQRLGFTKGTQMGLYGEVFDFIGEPMVLTDDFVVVDAQERKTGPTRRVRIPLPIVHMAISVIAANINYRTSTTFGREVLINSEQN